MSFPRYESYKDSGVEWLGEVPGHWNIDRLKRSLVSCKNGIWGDEAKQDENDIPCVRVADFDRQKLRVELNEPTIRNVTAKERVGRVLEQGNLLLEKSGGGELQPVGCVVLYDDPKPAVCSNFVAKMQIGDAMDPSFWRYVHAAAYAIRLTIGSINQTSGIQNLDQDRYFNERAAFPTFEEQQTIAAFLDRETAKIDALIAEQQRLIELLKEKRQAVISHAVTKGLNPNAPMKDSGIEWLGEVPEHWSLPKLKHFTNFSGGGTPSRENQSFWNGDIPWVSPKDMKIQRIQVAEEYITETGLISSSSSLLPAGLVLMVVRSGILKHTIPVAINEVPVALNQDMKALRFSHNSCLNWFFLRWVQGLNDLLLHAWAKQGATVESIEHSYLAETIIPMPPFTEQQTITAFLDNETAKLDTLTTEAKTAITLLQERRTALISAAVTGKIDVRKF